MGRDTVNTWLAVGQPPSVDRLARSGPTGVDEGSVRAVGPVPVGGGVLLEWSPDGSTILSLAAELYEGYPYERGAPPVAIDVATGDWHELDGAFKSAASWQRLAP